MGGNFWWVFDLIVIAVIVLFTINGAKKGFSKIIVAAIGCVVSFAVAWTLSKLTAETVYDKMFRQSYIETVEEAIEDYKPEDIIKTIIESNELSGVLSNENIKTILESDNSLDMLYQYANSQASNILDSRENFEASVINEFAKAFSSQVGVALPPYVAEGILGHLSDNEDMFLMTIEMLMTNSDELPQFIEENYIRGPATKIVSCAVFLIVFFVLMTVIVLVANKSGDFGLLNGYDRLDKFTGGILGLIEGIAAIIVIAFIVKIIVNMSESGTSFINIETIENTKIFKHFYSHLTDTPRS